MAFDILLAYGAAAVATTLLTVMGITNKHSDWPARSRSGNHRKKVL